MSMHKLTKKIKKSFDGMGVFSWSVVVIIESFA